MSKVRLRLSGALMFAANLVGYLTGFLFTVFITRRLSEEEFGVWALIGSFITYSLMPFNLVSSWISRDAARGKKILSSAAALFLLLTPISLIIYFSIALGSAAAINYDPGIIALGIIILIPYILLTLGTAIQSGYAPQNLGIARILFEISKVVIAFYLVVTLRLGLIGVFITLSAAYMLQAILLLQKSKPLTTTLSNANSLRLVCFKLSTRDMSSLRSKTLMPFLKGLYFMSPMLSAMLPLLLILTVSTKTFLTICERSSHTVPNASNITTSIQSNILINIFILISNRNKQAGDR